MRIVGALWNMPPRSAIEAFGSLTAIKRNRILAVLTKVWVAGP